MMAQSEYRETLVRELGGTRTLCVGMQNPSKAEADDPTVNDPTVMRLIGFTTRLGFGRLVVVNTYDRRATDPKDLYRWLYSMSIWDREAHRLRAYEIAKREGLAAEMFIAAWGNGHPDDNWPLQFKLLLLGAGIPLHVFGLNKNGTPKHPLARGKARIPDDTQPILWQDAKRAAA